jgi:hypothetical protein
MDKRVEPLEIATTTDGAVDLIQSYRPNDEEAAVVRIPLHQIDLVIQWLKDAKTELEKKAADRVTV